LAMRYLLKIDMDLPSIQSITYTFVAEQEDAAEGLVTFDTFVAAVSWFVKQCEAEWDLITAVKGMFDGALMGNQDGASCINKDHLVAQSTEITPEEAEEMLWMADWRSDGLNDGEEIDLTAFFCAILASFTQEYGILPPVPICNLTQWRREQQEGDPKSENPALFEGPARKSPTFVEPDHREWTKHAPDTCAWRAWLVLEEPENPRAPRIGPWWNAISLSLIVLSAVCMVVEPIVSPSSNKRSTSEYWTWYGLEIFFTVVFGTELLVKLFVHLMITPRFDTILVFFAMPTNMCDLVAVLPLFIELVLQQAMKSFRLLRLVRLARLSRMVRLVKLSQHKGFEVVAPASIVMVVVWAIFLIHEYSSDSGK